MEFTAGQRLTSCGKQESLLNPNEISVFECHLMEERETERQRERDKESLRTSRGE